ncbi:hypothetical protein S245_020801 [Arachis hypogaea]
MLSIATLNSSTPFNHSPDYPVCHILNRHSILLSIFSLQLVLCHHISLLGPHRPHPLLLRPLRHSQKSWRIVLPKPRSDPPLLLHNLNEARAPHAPSPAPQA